MADYQSQRQGFEQEEVALLALSVDPPDKAGETVDKVNPYFPVAYGLEVPRDADRIGAFWEERRKIFHATGFILNPESRVVAACYSTGPIGRIVAADALRYIQFLKKRAS